ncbi:hypothetical protein F4861DRAFT_509141 [Xylaria intraflava]|nr:hypothetical protein F4861DRAFT_509141 [Xylaria intraflava]
MITRGTPVGAVCFRCRLQLLRRLAPTRSVTGSATGDAVNNTTSDAAGSAFDDAFKNAIQDTAGNVVSKPPSDAPSDSPSDALNDAPSDAPSNAPSDALNDAPSDLSTAGLADNPTGQDHATQRRNRIGFRRIAFRKHHLSGSRILTETSTMLGIPMLGKPASVIVMKDGGDKKKKEIPRGSDPVEGVDDNPTPSIEELLEMQRTPLTVQEVRSNIGDFKPETDAVLPEKEFRKIQSLLTEGFTVPQLLDYIDWHKSEAKRESNQTATDKLPRPEFPWIRHITPWTPYLAQTDGVQGLGPVTQQGYVTKDMAPKDKLVVRLMCGCWGLSISEFQGQIGVINIALNNHDFVLLMRGTRRFLNALGKFWLGPGEKIEMIHNNTVLQLVTTKQKYESILADLDRTLKSVASTTFPVQLFASEAPNDEVLEEVGRITNSHVKTSHNRRRLHVNWIEPDSRVAQGLTDLEDVAHTVFRLLFTASKSQDTPSSLLSPIPAQESGGRLIVDATNKEKLMWKDKLAQWARYVLPLAPEENATATESAVPEERATNIEMPIKELQLPFEPWRETEIWEEKLRLLSDADAPTPSVEWTGTSRTSTVARFGQLLHRYQPSNPAPPLSDILASTDGRIFVPTTPHPLYLARYDTLNSNGNRLIPSKSTVVIYFWPSPSSNPASKSGPSAKKGKQSARAGDAPPAPILELRLVASEHEILGVESLRAIRRTHDTDVMLPSSHLDIRFTQTQYDTVQLRDHEHLADWQPISDFLRRARLDLANGKLEMPPRQRFPIPGRLFANADPNTDDIASVLYEFVGLELHRSITQPYNGHRLTYTSIEAGQGGGRRAEVTLEPLERPHPATPAEGDSLQDFLACCSGFLTDRALWAPLVNENDRVRI